VLAGFGILGVGAGAQKVEPAIVDPQLRTVVSAGSWRFLVYQQCSPEHCWSQSFLQELSDGVEPGVKATCPIQEIQVGHVVNVAEWLWEERVPVLRLEVAPSHGGFEPHALLLRPAKGCEYTLVREVGAA